MARTTRSSARSRVRAARPARSKRATAQTSSRGVARRFKQAVSRVMDEFEPVFRGLAEHDRRRRRRS